MPRVKLRVLSCVNSSRAPSFRALSTALLLIGTVAAAGCSKSLRLGMPASETAPSSTSRSGLGKPHTAARPAPQPARDYQWNGAPQRISEGGPSALKPGNAPLDVPPRVIAVAPPPSNYAAPPPRPLAPGMIEVQPGDSLYSLSQRHGVSISALMEENNLRSIALQPGQQLRLPARSRRRG